MTKSSAEPPAKRVKVTLACTICRKKKVKCDGIQPSCSRCKSIGTTCQYSDPPKKRGPPKGYVEVIENRAHRIESLLGKEYHQQLTPISPSTPSSLNSVETTDETMPCNVLLTLIADAVDAVQQRTATSVHGSNGNLSDFLANVSDEQSDTWIQHFFVHFNLIFPVLSRPSFEHQLKQDQLSLLVKYAVYAIGCRYADNTNSTDRLLFEHCESLLNLSQDPPTLATAQALIIMCWYTYLTADIHKCYSLFHRLESVVHFLGLGYEPDQFDINKAEMRRRAFWVAQVMDQWLSSCTGGHRLIQQPSDAKRWDCRWPQLEDNQLCALSGMPPTQSCFTVESALQMTSFKEMIRLSQIVRDMCDGARVEANLTEWLLHLPCYLDYGKPSHDPSPLAKVYRILYYTVQIMLCRQQANQGLSISICTTAANTIIHIAEQMLEQKQDKFLHNLFSLSVTLATSIHLESTSDTTPMCLYKSVSILKSINCTLLSSDYFDKLVDHFMTDVAPLKRARSPQQQQPSYDLLDTPFSFDLNDILLTDTFAPHLIDSNPYSPWFDFFEPFDPNPDSSCSSISLFTPSQSPTLSLDCQKELDVLSSPSFFSSFV